MAIIAISRGSMTLGQALAEKVAATLGLRCVGREIVSEAAQQLGVSKELMASKFEALPTFWERLTSERQVYMTAMQVALAEHVLRGDFVYHSWAGHMLLRGLPTLLKVRVIAPAETRVALGMEKRQVDRRTAEAYVRKVDEDRGRWTKFIYGIDWRDPLLYDAVINLGTLSMEGACEAVASMAKLEEFQLVEDQRGKLRDFAVASKVRLALARSSAGKALDLRVSVENGLVTLSGAAQAAAMSTSIGQRFEEELRAAAMQVEGVVEVRTDIRPVPVAPVD